MKLKTIQVGDKTYAEVQDDKPIYVHSDGKEAPFDAVRTADKIKELNAEAKTHREAKEALDARLRGFDGIEDPEGARRALETIKNIDEGKLLTAGKVQEIKEAAKRAAEEQVAAAAKASSEKLREVETQRDKIASDFTNEKIGGSFSRSKFIADKIAIPADLVQARFGSAFKLEDGKVVAYDHTGGKVFSRARPGEVADFDEALEVLVDHYPEKERILKGTGSSGSGARQSGGGGAGKRAIPRAEFDRMLPMDQAMIGRQAAKGEVAIVD